MVYLGFSLGLSACLLIYSIYIYIQWQRQRNGEKAFGIRHGCQPFSRRFPCKWPLGIDVLKAQYEATIAHNLLAFQTPYFEEYGPNIELKLLGSVGYLTFDPENIEAILSTRFEGTMRLRA